MTALADTTRQPAPAYNVLKPPAAAIKIRYCPGRHAPPPESAPPTAIPTRKHNTAAKPGPSIKASLIALGLALAGISALGAAVYLFG